MCLFNEHCSFILSHTVIMYYKNVEERNISTGQTLYSEGRGKKYTLMK